MGTPHEGFSYAQKEVNPCHTNLSVLVLTQAAVGLQTASNTAPSIRRWSRSATTNTNVTLRQTNVTAGPGSVSGTATSKPTLFVRSVKGTERLKLQKKSTTSSLFPKAVAMRRVTLWPFVSHVTRRLPLRVATGGGGKISTTFQSGQRAGASC
jgi:CRISPR/Cas system endoribonuclease Cas6 (RAMP superfamily)